MRFHQNKDKRKHPKIREKLIITSSDTRACQTCLLPVTTDFGAFMHFINKAIFFAKSKLGIWSIKSICLINKAMHLNHAPTQLTGNMRSVCTLNLRLCLKNALSSSQLLRETLRFSFPCLQ
jgi:hypothetical protein